MHSPTNDKKLLLVAALGLVLGGVLGIGGTFASSASVRGVMWGIDGTALVIASALLTVHYFRQGQDFLAAGFMVFAVGEGLILTGAAMDLAASTPLFGAGVALWAAALALISAPRVFPIPVRLLGLAAAVLMFVTALQIFAGVPLQPLSTPLPFFAYPVMVATFFGWVWSLLRPASR